MRPSNNEMHERSLLLSQGLRFCKKCEQIKPVSDFGKHSTTRDGLQVNCKICTNLRNRDYWNSSVTPEKRAKAAAATRDWQARQTSETKRRWVLENRLRRYGLTLDEYQVLKDKQNNKCWICLRELDDPYFKRNAEHVDHCHVTGKVRALLCSGCNTGLGSFQDNPVIMERAAEYLKWFQ